MLSPAQKGAIIRYYIVGEVQATTLARILTSGKLIWNPGR